MLSQQQADIPVPNIGALRTDLLVLVRGIAAFVQAPLGETLIRKAVRHDFPEYESAREAFWSARRFTRGVLSRRQLGRDALAHVPRGLATVRLLAGRWPHGPG